MSKKRGTNHFNDDWCREERFKGWLARAKLSSSARCLLCNKDFSIANGGVSEIDSYRKAKGHRTKESTSKSVSRLTFRNPSQPSTSSELNIVPLDNLHAEIRWALKVVESGFFYCSCISLNELFKAMFGKNSNFNE